MKVEQGRPPRKQAERVRAWCVRAWGHEHPAGVSNSQQFACVVTDDESEQINCCQVQEGTTSGDGTGISF